MSCRGISSLGMKNETFSHANLEIPNLGRYVRKKIMKIKEKIIQITAIGLNLALPMSYLVAIWHEKNGPSTSGAENAMAASFLWAFIVLGIILTSMILAVFTMINKSSIKSKYFKWGFSPILLQCLLIVLTVIVALNE